MSLEYPCVHFDNQKCKLHSEAGYTDWCVMGPCSHETPSRADVIRRLNDEDLAHALISLNSIGDQINFCHGKPECDEILNTDDAVPEEWCVACMLAWLQAPAQEVGGDPNGP